MDDIPIGYLLLLFAIGAIGSMLSGMVGIGGSIIKYLMLLYLPTLLGFAVLSAQEVSAISAVQVFFSCLAGMWAFREGHYIHKKLVLVMGSAILAGSFAGAYGSRFLSGDTIHMVYGFLASLAAILMLFPKKGRDQTDGFPTFNRTLACLLAAVIGVVSGIVGAAAAFITVPVMLVILKIPTRMTVASSLAITFISSIGSTVGKWMGGYVLPVPALVMVIASLLAAPVGSRL